MHKCGELNILCIGELMAGKSTFLQTYTSSEPSEEHFKIFVRRGQGAVGRVVFLHEIEERSGVDVYLKSDFDGVLFFVKIDHFHNTKRNVLEWLSIISLASGNNVYKIPIRLVVISSKNGQKYDDIGYGDRRRLQDEVKTILDIHQVIFVESDSSYQTQLDQFYNQVADGSAEGIKESAYASWHVRGWWDLLSLDQFKLQLMRLSEQFRETIQVHLKLSPKKLREGFIVSGF